MQSDTAQHNAGPSQCRTRLVAALCLLALVAAACTGSSDSAGGNTISLGQDTFSPGVEAADIEVDAAGGAINFNYETFDGETVAFADLPEGPVVLNFFASWCPSCITELPDFESVANDFEGEVTFLGLGTNERTEASAELVERTGITFLTGSDESGEVFQLFEGLGMPTTVFLDADHQIIRVHSGVFNAETLTDTINTDLLS